MISQIFSTKHGTKFRVLDYLGSNTFLVDIIGRSGCYRATIIEEDVCDEDASSIKNIKNSKNKEHD
jgi:hypothetical protein